MLKKTYTKNKITNPVSPGSSNKVKRNKYLRIFLWVFVGWIMLRGLLSFLPKDEVIVAEYKEPIIISDAAQSFAQAFTESYYTFESSKKEEHSNNLKPFIAQGLITSNAGLNFTNIDVDSYKVINTLPWSIQQTDENKSDIVIRVTIEETKTIENEKQEGGLEEVKTKSIQINRFTRLLQVPIAYNEKSNNFYVYDYPLVVPQLTNIPGEIAGVPDKSSISEEKAMAIKLSLEDFFKAYSEQAPSQIRYYMEDGLERIGYEGELLFNQIKSVKVYNASETEEADLKDVIAYVEVEFKDANNLIQIQHFTISLTFKEERWFIKEFKGGYKL